jgi:hypothetical protein
MRSSANETLFEVVTPLGFRVRTTADYWERITRTKHPALRGRMDAVKETLHNPTEIRVSKSDASVYLFYRSDGQHRWVCAVARRLNGDGFLVTAYRTSNIKEGSRVWPR